MLWVNVEIENIYFRKNDSFYFLKPQFSMN